jgi:uncharacterized glyoxalase superfamily protein PhnB
MVTLSKVAPVFAVADISATIGWYESQLGFVSFCFPPKPPHAFAIICRNGVEIMFQRLEGYQPPRLYEQRNGGVWNAYIRMEGIKEFYESIKDQVEIKMPLRKQPYGDWEFEVTDPNGYLLVFSELTE